MENEKIGKRVGERKADQRAAREAKADIQDVEQADGEAEDEGGGRAGRPPAG